MKSVLPKWMTLLVVMAIAGCAGQMTKLDDTKIAKPDSNSAVIVFMRSSFVASAIGVELFEIDNGNLKFIGQLPNGSKIAYRTTPGQKVYMAYGSAADFMIANVEAGKTYYSIVRPNWGTGGFAPTPVRTDGTTDYNTQARDFTGWRDDTDLLEKSQSAEEWFAKNKDRYMQIYKTYWSRFETKSAEQKQERTLRPEDGQ